MAGGKRTFVMTGSVRYTSINFTNPTSCTARITKTVIWWVETMQFIVLFNPVGNFSGNEIKGSIYKLLSLQNRQKSQFKKIDYFFPLL